MKHFLKFGGLALSAILTLSLFIRLFGAGAYGISVAIMALILFEGGALAWARIVDHAEGGQRGIAYFALWYCAVVSVVSSGAEIILATQLWQAPFDINFVTLAIIATSLAVNVLGVLAYEQNDPDTAEKHRELNRLAKESQAQASIEESFTTHAVMQAKAKAKSIAGEIAEQVGEVIKANAVQHMTKGKQVSTFARDGVPMLTASAGGNVQTFTRDEVEAMIAQALEAQGKRKQSRNGKSVEVDSESPKD